MDRIQNPKFHSDRVICDTVSLFFCSDGDYMHVCVCVQEKEIETHTDLAPKH